MDYPKVVDRKNKIVAKHAKGVEFLMKKNKVDWIKGYATLKGGGRVEVTGEQGTQTLEAKNIILATGSEARMLPGLKPDADAHSDQHRDSEPDGDSADAGDHRRGCGGRGVCVDLQPAWEPK